MQERTDESGLSAKKSFDREELASFEADEIEDQHAAPGSDGRGDRDPGRRAPGDHPPGFRRRGLVHMRGSDPEIPSFPLRVPLRPLSVRTNAAPQDLG